MDWWVTLAIVFIFAPFVLVFVFGAPYMFPSQMSPTRTRVLMAAVVLLIFVVERCWPSA